MAEKLIRDKLVLKIPEDELRIATEDEYPAFLAAKLQEEVEELLTSNGDPEEFADVYEVLAALQELYKLDETSVRRVQVRKWMTKGGFAERVIWTNAPDEH